MIGGLQHVQRGAPNKVIVMTAILERIIDDAERASSAYSCRATRPAASCLGLSITSSPSSGSASATPSRRCALLSAARPTSGMSRRKVAWTGSTQSSRRISENWFRSFSTRRSRETQETNNHDAVRLFDPAASEGPQSDPRKDNRRVRMTINAGGVGEDGMLTLVKKGCEMLSYVLVVIAGPHAKRKIHGQFIVDSTADKYEDQIWRSRRTLRRILKSAFNLDPNDISAEAKAKRTVGDEAFDDLSSMRVSGSSRPMAIGRRRISFWESSPATRATGPARSSSLRGPAEARLPHRPALSALRPSRGRRGRGEEPMKKARLSAVSAEQDEWLRRAYAAAVAAAKDFVSSPGPIHSGAAIGRLGNSEWGWIASAIIWGWVATRSEQAAAEGWSLERLPEDRAQAVPVGHRGGHRDLAEARRGLSGDFDWSQPASAWSKEELAKFLLTAFALIQRATIARDVVENQIEPTSADVTARQINAAAGNPRMTAAELKALDNGDCPF